MEPFSEMFDITLSYDTDILFSSGDLDITNGVDYIEREIYKILVTFVGEWKLNPTIGCGLKEFVGQENSRNTAQKIEKRIQDSLILTVYPAQVNVRVVPSNYNTIFCFIDVIGPNINITSIPFEFTFTTGTIKIHRADKNVQNISDTNLDINDITNMRKPNKYQNSFRKV